MLKHYAKRVGITVKRFDPHAVRATAATNALDQCADIARVQEWLRHANVGIQVQVILSAQMWTKLLDHVRFLPVAVYALEVPNLCNRDNTMTHLTGPLVHAR